MSYYNDHVQLLIYVPKEKYIGAYVQSEIEYSFTRPL